MRCGRGTALARKPAFLVRLTEERARWEPKLFLLFMELSLADFSFVSAERDHCSPADSKCTRSAGRQVYTASLHERTSVIDPDSDAPTG